MLPARHRLKGKRVLARVRSSPRVYRSRLLTLRVVERGDQAPSRVACAAGLHVSRRAVDRHRVVRWLREAVRRILPYLRLGVDMRLTANQPADQYSYENCCADVETLCRRAGLLSVAPPH